MDHNSLAMTALWQKFVAGTGLHQTLKQTIAGMHVICFRRSHCAGGVILIIFSESPL
jgi:hypothetical protein